MAVPGSSAAVLFTALSAGTALLPCVMLSAGTASGVVIPVPAGHVPSLTCTHVKRCEAAITQAIELISMSVY